MQLHKITIASGLALALSFSGAFAGSSKPGHDELSDGRPCAGEHQKVIANHRGWKDQRQRKKRL